MNDIVLKKSGLDSSYINEFELLGSGELAITTSFAFVLSKSPNVIQALLKHSKLKTKITKDIFRKIQVSREVSREEGRTDIEIYCPEEFHLILEAKVRKNRVLKQREQYLSSFNQDVKKKIMLFVTSERTVSSEKNEGIETVFTTWREIQMMLAGLNLEGHEKELVSKFLRFYERRIKMNEQKEILIQDLRETVEIERFSQFQIYKRDPTFGAPLYFAPHYTKSAEQDEGVGISYLSKILGVLTIHPDEILQFTDDLLAFADSDKSLVDKWVSGIQYAGGGANIPTNKEDGDGSHEKLTYYFLENPIKITPALQKDSGNEKGCGKGWISKMIPKNRCVTFATFAMKMSENK